MTALEQALVALARFCETQRIPYMVIGGVANLMWGQPRATLDVDASILVEETNWSGVITALRRHFRVIPSDPLTFVRDTHVLPVETEQGVRIDLVWAWLPYEHKAIARAVCEDIAGCQVRVCRPEDLIIHKIISDRPKDREDVQAVVRRQAGRLDRAYLTRIVQALARALDRPDLLAFLDACFRRRHSR